MRRMNSVATPGVYYSYCAVFQRPVELASVSGPCAQQCSAPVVYPSCASGYHRRALSQLPLLLHPRSGSALRCGRTLRSLVCSATATESERESCTQVVCNMLRLATNLPKCPIYAGPASARASLPKNFDAAGTEPRLYDWYVPLEPGLSLSSCKGMLIHLEHMQCYSLEYTPVFFQCFGAWHSGGNRMASSSQMSQPLAGHSPCLCHRQMSLAGCTWAMQCL